MQQYIDKAVEQFRTLITEQLARQNRMEAGEQAKDFANLPHLTIGICGGDGIGPIITAQAARVLEKLLADELKSLRAKRVRPLGGGAAGGVYVPYPIRVTVGGATVFVLEVAQFLKV